MQLVDIPREECARLLSAGVAGRVALSTQDGPHLLLVNYAVVDDSIVIRTGSHSRLASYGPSSMLAFEVDELDYEGRTGWSVVVRGRAHAVVDAAELERVQGEGGPQPWSSGERNTFIRFPLTELSGRRLEPRRA